MKRLLLLFLVLLAVAGCTDPVRKVSESSLRNATARGATEEMRGLGYTIKRGMRCRTLSADTMSVVRVQCLGHTAHEEPVRVDAVASDAASAHPRQEFVITVSGREIVRTHCLGRGCQDRDR
ncbi:hypothetical protein [Actinomadura sp. DC4]|uniref:hypothetical protein n=1 Tax=Actinomadura sp. DC4 TaxID=3055069 RepID=UPI0025B04675|nr:hypothetical protein [Actinomadura sp. DC4]MDN3356739.1 hypothetical protein [Actinomadura sp. DC4]